MRDVLTNPTLASALELAEVDPDAFAGDPEILVPLAAELLWRGAFERGPRAFTLAQETGVDPGQQPELAVKLAAVSTLHCTFIGQFEEALAHRRRPGPLRSRLTSSQTGPWPWTRWPCTATFTSAS